MLYLTMYLIWAFGLSLLQRYICAMATPEIDEALCERFGLHPLVLEAVLLVIGAIAWPWLIRDILTWHRSE